MADGQVTQGNEIIKPNVRKVRRIGETVIGGFAGGTHLWPPFVVMRLLNLKFEWIMALVAHGHCLLQAPQLMRSHFSKSLR